MGKALLQSDRNATLLIDVLRFHVQELRIPLGKDWWTRRRSFLTASPIWQNESEQGLKPNHSYTCAARLKPCPDTKHQGGDSRKPRVSSGTSSLKCRNSRPRTIVLG
jgi:hypothetical protein